MKPEVLILTDYFAPGYKAGGPIQSVVNMIALLKNEISWSILTRNTDWFDDRPYDLPKDRWISTESYKVKYLSGRFLFAVIREMRNQGNNGQIYFNGIYAPEFHALPLLYALLFMPGKRLIVAPRGMLNENAIALKQGKKRALLRLMKWLGIERKVGFHAASEAEVIAIKKVFPKADVSFCSNVPINLDESGQHQISDHKSFVSVGRISKVKNTAFLIEQFRDIEEATLHLIGSADDEEYEGKCRGMAASSRAKVVFHGPLPPPEARKMLSKAGFAISATTGENFGHAILESLSMGVPVIISDRTPWNGVQDAGAGWVIPLEEANAWGEAMRKAMSMTEDSYATMSGRARDFVRTNFDFDDIRNKYLNLFS